MHAVETGTETDISTFMTETGGVSTSFDHKCTDVGFSCMRQQLFTPILIRCDKNHNMLNFFFVIYLHCCKTF